MAPFVARRCELAATLRRLTLKPYTPGECSSMSCSSSAEPKSDGKLALGRSMLRRSRGSLHLCRRRTRSDWLLPAELLQKATPVARRTPASEQPCQLAGVARDLEPHSDLASLPSGCTWPRTTPPARACAGLAPAQLRTSRSARECRARLLLELALRPLGFDRQHPETPAAVKSWKTQMLSHRASALLRCHAENSHGWAHAVGRNRGLRPQLRYHARQVVGQSPLPHPAWQLVSQLGRRWRPGLRVPDPSETGRLRRPGPRVPDPSRPPETPQSSQWTGNLRRASWTDEACRYVDL